MRILIADDHAIFREGLRLVIRESGMQCEVGEAGDGDGLLEKVRDHDWDVLILDISFPGKSGLELLREVKAIRPRLPVLVLSMHAEEQYAVRALRSGASGYLMKESASDELLTAVDRIARGGRYLTPRVAEALAAEIAGEGTDDPHRLLSDRELEVLRLTARGTTPTEIASILGISIKTVSTYKSRILQKLGLDNTAQIIHYAIEHGLAG
ncbi:MAG: response regulator [Thermoanaerobaculia bacterium]